LLILNKDVQKKYGAKIAIADAFLRLYIIKEKFDLCELHKIEKGVQIFLK